MAVASQAPQTTDSACAAELQRKDRWQIDPLVFFCLFSAFGLWATFRAFQNNFYETTMLSFQQFADGFRPHYLSPFYSPTLDLETGRVFGMQLFSGGVHLPNGWAISPALLILPFPLSFRLSCYYYRRSIYRAYLGDPAGCAVPENNLPSRLLWTRVFRRYMGERVFPFLAQNFHRYAFYAAALFVLILWYDALLAFFFVNAQGQTRFGVGVGSLVMLANVTLLSLYTFSCHSWRHLIGGNADCYSCTALARSKYGLWQKISFLNERHGRWAMWSLVSVGLTDVYIYLVTRGVLSDFRLF